MPLYRIYVLDEDLRVAGSPIVFECADDGEAIRRDRQHMDGQDIELWRDNHSLRCSPEKAPCSRERRPPRLAASRRNVSGRSHFVSDASPTGPARRRLSLSMRENLGDLLCHRLGQRRQPVVGLVPGFQIGLFGHELNIDRERHISGFSQRTGGRSIQHHENSGTNRCPRSVRDYG